MTYVLDGGVLRHHVRWVRGKTYENIMQAYVEYVTKNGQPKIIFHRYQPGPSAKDATHKRRAANGIGPKIKIYSSNDTQS